MTNSKIETIPKVPLYLTVEIPFDSFYVLNVGYNLFLFDADDTLFDFQTSESVAFSATLSHFGIHQEAELIYRTYRRESAKLWRLLELGKIEKSFLQIERFRRIIGAYALPVAPEKMSGIYLEILPELAHLNDYATEICQSLNEIGEVAIITNGIDHVQKRRLKKSGLSPYISFMIVSEACGYAKPDRRFFEYTMRQVNPKKTVKPLVIGDRLETDIRGANDFGLDSCWYNPKELPENQDIKPKFQITHLSQISKWCHSPIGPKRYGSYDPYLLGPMGE